MISSTECNYKALNELLDPPWLRLEDGYASMHLTSRLFLSPFWSTTREREKQTLSQCTLNKPTKSLIFSIA